jgi:hypothetical protein
MHIDRRMAKVLSIIQLKIDVNHIWHRFYSLFIKALLCIQK